MSLAIGRVINVVGRAAVCLTLLSASLIAGGPTFEVILSPDLHEKPFTGRVYVFTDPDQLHPREELNWFNPQPFLARDVTNWPAGKAIVLSPTDANVLTYPRDFSNVDLDGHRAQAVARLNPYERNVGTGAGNGFSDTKTVEGAGSVSLVIDQRVEPRVFEETKWSKLLTVSSPLLSEFHQRPIELRAAVILPQSYAEHPARRYPTIVTIPGFGGTHHMARRSEPVEEENDNGVEFLRIMLDPSAPLGHHVFADSANNGPVGRALIEELIPAFHAQFRSIDDPRARFLTGHSSGGWSSLWLQITYPDQFGGVWSTAPDPVDFRDFQRIDLYAPDQNMYHAPTGERRPLAIRGGKTALWYDDFAWMEHVLGPGGQLHSFEAVFSSRLPDGTPRLLYDRKTGDVDPVTARSWEPYDIRLVLERNWPTLGPKLRGKLHIFMGSADTFLLDGATRLLKQSLQDLNSDAIVEIHEGHDHSTLLNHELRQRIRREMTSAFLAEFPDWPND